MKVLSYSHVWFSQGERRQKLNLYKNIKKPLFLSDSQFINWMCFFTRLCVDNGALLIYAVSIQENISNLCLIKYYVKRKKEKGGVIVNI